MLGGYRCDIVVMVSLRYQAAGWQTHIDVSSDGSTVSIVMAPPPKAAAFRTPVEASSAAVIP